MLLFNVYYAFLFSVLLQNWYFLFICEHIFGWHFFCVACDNATSLLVF